MVNLQEVVVADEEGGVNEPTLWTTHLDEGLLYVFHGEHVLAQGVRCRWICKLSDVVRFHSVEDENRGSWK